VVRARVKILARRWASVIYLSWFSTVCPGKYPRTILETGPKPVLSTVSPGKWPKTVFETGPKPVLSTMSPGKCPRTVLETGPKPVLSTVSAHYYSPVIVVFTILK
jgi:hypothetical protein